MFHKTILWVLTSLIISGLPAAGSAATDSVHTRFFFLHHSTGRNLLVQGGARDYLNSLNNLDSTDHVLWDHDYNYIGLSNSTGDLQGYDYDIPNDNTDPDGLYALWTTSNSARDSLLSRYDVIAFKSCFPASDIVDEAMLEQYKIWYRGIRDQFDQHPEVTFVVMSQPPLHRLVTDVARADRARAFANWLGSDDFLAGHPNVAYFNFFDQLAAADDGTATRNMLKYAYESSHTGTDSHPNALANETVAPNFVDFLVALTKSAAFAVTPGAVGACLYPNVPNPFNPATTISFSLNRPAAVELRVFDLRGRLVNTLLSGTASAGDHKVVWRGESATGRDVPSGTYFYLLKTGSETYTHKMQLLK